MNSLDVIMTWLKAHDDILTRFASRKYFGFTLFVTNP